MSISQQIERLLSELEPSARLNVLEKLSMKLRKANGIRINDEVNAIRSKYPRIKK